MKQLALLASLLLLAMPPVLAESSVATAFEMVLPPGNIAITPHGRIVVSLHQHFAPELRAVELKQGADPAPFPNEALARFDAANPLSLDSVLGVQSDDRGVVWLLDNGMREKTTPKLLAWDTQGDELHRVIWLPKPVSIDGSFLNDLAIDEKRGAIYIADPATPTTSALVVVDLATGAARRVLQGHASVVPEAASPDLVIDGTPVEVLTPDGRKVRPRVGVNPIALDPRDEWLYFGPMHGMHHWRVRADDLANAALSPADLAARVEKLATRPMSDGSIVDAHGNIYITDIANGAVGVLKPDGMYETIARDPLLSWPDAFAFAPDGKLYVVANQLHRGPVLNAGTDAAVRPFRILMFDPYKGE